MLNKKIIIANLLVFVGYMGLLALTGNPFSLLMSCIPIAIQVLANFILFFVHLGHEDKTLAPTYVLCSILILLIGYSACWGLANVMPAQHM
jgi:hypothetical protein